MIGRLSCFVSLLLIGLTGCSATKKQTAEIISANPYELTVVEDLYDGETLFVQLELQELRPNTSQQSFLNLTGFGGELQEQKVFNLVDLKGSLPELTLSLPFKNLSDYQVQLYWGQNAKSFYQAYYPKLVEKLQISSGQIDKIRSCEQEVCQIKFRISCVLKNNSEMTVPSAALQLSLLEKNLEDFEPQVHYSKKIQLSDLDLPPGKERKLDYLIVQPVELNELATFAELQLANQL